MLSFLRRGALSLAVVSLLASSVSAEVFEKLRSVPEGENDSNNTRSGKAKTNCIVQAGNTHTTPMATNRCDSKSPCSSTMPPASSSVCWTYPRPTTQTTASISAHTMR